LILRESGSIWALKHTHVNKRFYIDCAG